MFEEPRHVALIDLTDAASPQIVIGVDQFAQLNQISKLWPVSFWFISDQSAVCLGRFRSYDGAQNRLMNIEDGRHWDSHDWKAGRFQLCRKRFDSIFGRSVRLLEEEPTHDA